MLIFGGWTSSRSATAEKVPPRTKAVEPLRMESGTFGQSRDTAWAMWQENVDVTRRAVPLFVGLGAIELDLLRLTSATRLVAAGACRCGAHRGRRQRAAWDASVIGTKYARRRDRQLHVSDIGVGAGRATGVKRLG